MTVPTITETVEGQAVDIFARSAEKPFDETYSSRPTSSLNYVICFEERSGSTMLCSLLGKTGVLGKPDEFINPRGPMQVYVERCNAHYLSEYFAYLRCELATPNGVFGMKSAFLDFRPLVEAGLVGQLLEPLRYVYLTREDVLRQAVSSALARMTGIWHSRPGDESRVGTGDLEMDEKLILRLLDGLLGERQKWEEFFAGHQVEPLRLTYEQLVDSPVAIVRRIAQYLGVHVDEGAIPAVSDTRPLATTTNEEWVRTMRERHSL